MNKNNEIKPKFHYENDNMKFYIPLEYYSSIDSSWNNGYIYSELYHRNILIRKSNKKYSYIYVITEEMKYNIYSKITNIKLREGLKIDNNIYFYINKDDCNKWINYNDLKILNEKIIIKENENKILYNLVFTYIIKGLLNFEKLYHINRYGLYYYYDSYNHQKKLTKCSIV